MPKKKKKMTAKEFDKFLREWEKKEMEEMPPTIRKSYKKMKKIMRDTPIDGTCPTCGHPYGDVIGPPRDYTIPKRTYVYKNRKTTPHFCRECKRYHKLYSKIGKAHKKYSTGCTHRVRFRL